LLVVIAVAALQKTAAITTTLWSFALWMVKGIWLVLAERPGRRGMLAEKPVSRDSSGM